AHASRSCLRIFQKDNLLFGHALLAKEVDQLRIATILFRERIEHIFLLPLEHPDHKDPGPLRLPISTCDSRRVSRDTAKDDEKRNPRYFERASRVHFHLTLPCVTENEQSGESECQESKTATVYVNRRHFVHVLLSETRS